MEQIMYIDTLALKYKIKFRHNPSYWNKVLIGIIYRMFVAGGLLSLVHRFEVVTTDFGGNNLFDYSFAQDPFYTRLTSLPIVAMILVLLLLIAVKVFFINPLNISVRSFFLNNAAGDHYGLHLIDGFKHSYFNIVKAMFARNIRILSWSILFIIPGIVKAYKYRMVPYILAENPDIDTHAALRLSEDMMHGNKEKMFNYDLSFIGWYIGSLVTFGLVGIYYYTPYKLSCDTEVYRIISGKLGSNIKFGRKPVIYPVMNQGYYSRKAPR